MPKKRQVRIQKHDAFREICSKRGIDWSDEFIASGSTITGLGVQMVLDSISRLDGIPPSYLNKREKTIWRLLHKSQESFILSLETINKVTISYRLESFCFLFVNAWELLLKAKILDDGGNIENKDDPKYTIGVRKCANKVFNEHDAVYQNLIKIVYLRGEATHYFIDTIPPSIMGILQSGVINYYENRKNWFESDITEHIKEGMMYLVVDADISKFTPGSLKKSLSTDTFRYLTEWEKQIKIEVENLKDEDIGKYFQPINIKLSYKRNPSKSDTLKYIADEGVGIKKVVLTKDPDKDYPFFTLQSVVEFQERGYDVNSHIISKVLPLIYKTKENKRFCYIPTKHDQPQYSQAFIDWVINKINKDDQFINKCKAKYRELIKGK